MFICYLPTKHKIEWYTGKNPFVSYDPIWLLEHASILKWPLVCQGFKSVILNCRGIYIYTFTQAMGF